MDMYLWALAWAGLLFAYACARGLYIEYPGNADVDGISLFWAWMEVEDVTARKRRRLWLLQRSFEQDQIAFLRNHVIQSDESRAELPLSALEYEKIVVQYKIQQAASTTSANGACAQRCLRSCARGQSVLEGTELEQWNKIVTLKKDSWANKTFWQVYYGEDSKLSAYLDEGTHYRAYTDKDVPPLTARDTDDDADAASHGNLTLLPVSTRWMEREFQLWCVRVAFACFAGAAACWTYPIVWAAVVGALTYRLQLKIMDPVPYVLSTVAFVCAVFIAKSDYEVLVIVWIGAAAVFGSDNVVHAFDHAAVPVAIAFAVSAYSWVFFLSGALLLVAGLQRLIAYDAGSWKMECVFVFCKAIALGIVLAFCVPHRAPETSLRVPPVQYAPCDHNADGTFQLDGGFDARRQKCSVGPLNTDCPLHANPFTGEQLVCAGVGFCTVSADYATAYCVCDAMDDKSAMHNICGSTLFVPNIAVLGAGGYAYVTCDRVGLACNSTGGKAPLQSQGPFVNEQLGNGSAPSTPFQGDLSPALACSCVCNPDYYGPLCSIFCDCNGHGSCDADGKCSCDVGWTGATCNNTECSGSGRKVNGTCQCDGDRLPSNASRQDCALPCPDCNERGVCQGTFVPPNNQTVASCACQSGWSDASNCSRCVDATCASPIPNVGSCVNGTCGCQNSFLSFVSGCRDCVHDHQDPASGCVTCLDGFFGANCTRVCPCGPQPGTQPCDQSTGACRCNATEFAGPSCQCIIAECAATGGSCVNETGECNCGTRCVIQSDGYCGSECVLQASCLPDGTCNPDGYAPALSALAAGSNSKRVPLSLGMERAYHAVPAVPPAL